MIRIQVFELFFFFFLGKIHKSSRMEKKRGMIGERNIIFVKKWFINGNASERWRRTKKPGSFFQATCCWCSWTKPPLAPCRQSSNDDKRQRRCVGYSSNREHVKNTINFKISPASPPSFAPNFLFSIFFRFSTTLTYFEKRKKKKRK